MRIRTIIIGLFLFHGGHMVAPAQSPGFYHIGTAEGLTNNMVNAVARDQQGILWIGTSEGLNSFDGFQLRTYLHYDHPALGDNNIQRIFADSRNRIWILTESNRLTMLDEERKFRAVVAGDSTIGRITHIYETRSHGLVIIRNGRHYRWRNDRERFERIHAAAYLSLGPTVRLLSQPGLDSSVFYFEKKLILLDHQSQKIRFALPFPDLDAVATMGDSALLAIRNAGDWFYQLSLLNGKITDSFPRPRDGQGKPMTSDIRQICAIGPRRFLISTRFAGLYALQLDPLRLENWQHDPLDPRSIGGNNTYHLVYDSSGYVFITTLTSGLHYFHVNQQQAYTRPYFKNESGEVFDGFIQSVTGRGDQFWLGSQDRLIRWNPRTGAAAFPDLWSNDKTNLRGRETLRVVSLHENQLWVGTSRYGILVCDTNARVRQQLASSADGMPSYWINAILHDKEGNGWIGTARGLCVVKKGENKATSFFDHPLLSVLSREHITRIMEDRQKRIWIGTGVGAWLLNTRDSSLKNYTTRDGLISNTILAIAEDQQGNIYFGTDRGISILGADQSVKSFDRRNGLRNDRCEGILCDNNGLIWIGNANCILRYNPADGSFLAYEEGHGISHAGFRMRSSFKNENGELFWGTDKGITWFNPEQMELPLPIGKPQIISLQAGDSLYPVVRDRTLEFSHSTPWFRLAFSSGDLGASSRLKLRYKLEGLQDEWQTPGLPGEAYFSKLPPGSYQFQLQSSLDGIRWTEAGNVLRIVVHEPWWNQACFRWLMMLTIGLLIYAWWRRQQLIRRNREVREVVDYFANSRYEKAGVNDVLWDICRNCMAHLGFVDCVVYLYDEEKQVLVQKAAYGPKSPEAYAIDNPLELPLGRGIVGSAGAERKPIVVHDTKSDSRYLVDDMPRRSEIAVPIVHEGRLIGVIDSEHPRKRHFRRWHLRALQAVARVAGPKISHAMATEAMQESERELMKLNVKMAESRFQNLRLQMNPHFLFNSLSSIQHLIVSQQTNRAYRYLTIFSNFLRTLLKYADKNFVPLDEELKILKMYIELESLRFDDSFHYQIHIDDGLENDNILLPTLMIQPFVENAIWHGLLHKEGEKQLEINFSGEAEEILTCVISDNGIGRDAAARIKSASISANMHESRGIDIIRERLELLERKTGQPARVEFDDKPGGGTRVTIQIPYYNQEEL